MPAEPGVRIGIDLGGTKIEGVALTEDGREIVRRRVPTPAGDYGGTVRAVADLVAEIAGNAGSEAGSGASVGVAIPGTVSPATGLVKNANSTCLIGHAFDKDLEAAIGRPIRMANDANCFALSEAADGAAAGFAVVFGVIIGTGTGGGVVVNGQGVTGPNAIAGEWGHNPLPWAHQDAPPRGGGVAEQPGPACYCGKFGCIETFLSGPGLERDYAAAGGETKDAAAIARAAAMREPRARAAMDRYEDRMARALASVINVLDPDIVVLGGGLSNIEGLYEGVRARWSRYVFSDETSTLLVPARHGGASGVRGAARLWPPNAD